MTVRVPEVVSVPDVVLERQSVEVGHPVEETEIVVLRVAERDGDDEEVWVMVPDEVPQAV